MNFQGAIFDIEDYHKTDIEIGKGASSTVFLVEKESDGTQYAAKIINEGEICTSSDQTLLLQESSILHKLNHPAIVKFYGINFHSFGNETKLEPTILTEYLKNGSISNLFNKDKLSQSNVNWNGTKKFICLLGISDAMRYLHEQGILHRDLKPDNILVDENYYPRISDFGLSRCFSQSLSKSFKFQLTKGIIGTPMYMAPELLNEEDNVDQSVDVYSFSLIAYQIVSGNQPYPSNTHFFMLYKKIVNCERPKLVDSITEPMKNLISRCWDQNPKNRPSFNEIFNELASSVSSNVSYLNEEIDLDEVKSYIDILEKDKKSKEAERKSSESSKNVNQEMEQSSKKVGPKKTLSQPKIDDFSEKIETKTIKVPSFRKKTRKVENDSKSKDDKIIPSDSNDSNDNSSKIITNNSNNYNNDSNANSIMLKELIGSISNINEICIKSIDGNLLHLACKLGNMDIFLSIFSLDKFDTTERTVFIFIVLRKF